MKVSTSIKVSICTWLAVLGSGLGAYFVKEYPIFGGKSNEEETKKK